jgi:hypothetical protein
MILPPTHLHEVLKNDFTEVLRRHQDALTPPEMLAIAAQFLGMLLALQDQQTMTVEQGMTIIQANFEIGNAAVVEGLFAPGGTA